MTSVKRLTLYTHAGAHIAQDLNQSGALINHWWHLLCCNLPNFATVSKHFFYLLLVQQWLTGIGFFRMWRDIPCRYYRECFTQFLIFCSSASPTDTVIKRSSLLEHLGLANGWNKLSLQYLVPALCTLTSSLLLGHFIIYLRLVGY